MRELQGDNRELTAAVLYNEDEHKNAAKLETNLQAYRATVKQICKDLQKVGIDITAPATSPPLVRKSVALSVMHDSMAGLLVMEYIRVKRELEAWNAAHPLTGDDQVAGKPQRPVNKAERAAQQSLYTRLFALMGQLRQNDKAFFANLATLDSMGVSQPDRPNKTKGPPSPRRNIISDVSDADLDDAAVLREIKATALRQLAFVERMEGVVDAEVLES